MMLQSCTQASKSSSPVVASSSSSQEFSAIDDSQVESSSTPASDAVSAIDAAFEKQFLGDIKPVVKKADMDIGVCIIDMKSGTRANKNGDKRMDAASMIKLIVAASFLQYVEDGNLSLNDTYTIKDSDIVGGTGSLGGRGAGAEVTYDELLEKMISQSDNTAANILIDEMGMGLVNRTARELNLKSTKLNRLMMDEEAIEEGVENYVSANDVAEILMLAYNGQLVSAKASKILLSALEKQEDNNGISKGLPSKVKFAHKTGSLANAQHDGGIVEDPNGNDFILVVLCGGKGFSQDGAFDVMESIGKIAYEDVSGKQ